MDFGVILLAAGGSRRMAGAHKLLLPWGAGSVVGHALSAALGAAPKVVVVVTGCRADEVRAACENAVRDYPAHMVQYTQNDRWAEGMYTSATAGVAALPPGLDGWFIALGDMPMVPSQAYLALMQRYETQPGRILIPVWEGRRGHPVLFPANLPMGDPPADADAGLRGLIRQFPEKVVEVPVPHSGICVDVDTPEEYERYAPRL